LEQTPQDLQKGESTMNTQIETVQVDLNDAAFLAALVTKYIAAGNNTDHLQELVVRLTPKAGC